MVTIEIGYPHALGLKMPCGPTRWICCPAKTNPSRQQPAGQHITVDGNLLAKPIEGDQPNSEIDRVVHVGSIRPGLRPPLGNLRNLRRLPAEERAARSGGIVSIAADSVPKDGVAQSRGLLVRDSLVIAAYALPVGLVYGLATLQAGLSLLDTVAMCLLVLAGGAQFAAVGMIQDGAPWLAIAGVTLLVNARHLLYSAAIAPYLTTTKRRERAFLAHFLTDESFALSLAHFRRIGRLDRRGFWFAAMAVTVPWTAGSTIGYLAAGAVDIQRLGLDIAFPAAMAGLSLGMVSGRRDVAAVLGAVAVAVPVGLIGGASVGLIAGALIGPLIGLAVPPSEGDESSAPDPRAGRRGGPAVSLAFAPLALLMWAATYPSRALPMLAPGIERLPRPAVAYLRLAGPSALAALAAVNCLLTSERPPGLLIGVEPLAVLLCALIVARTRLLLLGVTAAIVLVAVARAIGVAA